MDPTGPYINALGHVHPDASRDAHGNRDPQAGSKRYLYCHLYPAANVHALCHLYAYADHNADLDSDDNAHPHPNRHPHQHADTYAYLHDNAHADAIEHGY